MLREIALQMSSFGIVLAIIFVNGLLFKFVIPQYENFSLIGYFALAGVVVVYGSLRAAGVRFGR
jgi:uncharacterized membrane protein